MMYQKRGSADRRTALLLVALLLQFGAAAELLLDTAGVANYNRWVLMHHATLPALRPIWATAKGPSCWTGDSAPTFQVSFWRADGSLRKFIQVRSSSGVEVVGPYVTVGYGSSDSCLVYDSTGRLYIRKTPDSTVVWGPRGRLRFAGWYQYQVCLGDPTMLVTAVGDTATSDTVLVLGRDAALLSKVVGKHYGIVGPASIYQSQSGTSVVAVRDFLALDRQGNVLWRKPRGCQGDIYLSADGTTFARISGDSVGIALVAYDGSGATIARIRVADYPDYPEDLRLSANGWYAGLCGKHTAALVSITKQKMLWQVVFADSDEGVQPRILDVRSDTVVIAIDSTRLYRSPGPYTVHMLTNGHEAGQPLRLRPYLDASWQCSVAGDLLVARCGDRFRVYSLWR